MDNEEFESAWEKALLRIEDLEKAVDHLKAAIPHTSTTKLVRYFTDFEFEKEMTTGLPYMHTQDGHRQISTSGSCVRAERHPTSGSEVPLRARPLEGSPSKLFDSGGPRSPCPNGSEVPETICEA